MKNFFSLLTCLLIAVTAQAQYTTPDTGVDWTLEDIASEVPDVLSNDDNVYTLHEDLIIASNDTFRIDADITLRIDADVQITIFGTFDIDADEVLITATEESSPFRGIKLEEFSDVNIQNTTIEYSGGLQVLTENFTLNNCVLQNNVTGVNTGAVVNLYQGAINITNNHFLNNLTPAIASGATQNVSGDITGNIIEYNNSENSNRPQINMGPTQTTTPLRIVDNIITGDRDFEQVGGIGISNLLGTGTVLAEIENNTITDNRYGITITGANATVTIKNNIIEDNDTQGNPMMGGSGINLNSASGGQNIIITENQFRRNLWGITIQGSIDVNLGDDEDNPGGNVFADNENNGEVFALYNNGESTVMAKHNCWIEGEEITLEDAENVIFHQIDDASLGEVIFDPVCTPTDAEDFLIDHFTFYPNPAKNKISFDNNLNFDLITISDIQGKKVFEKRLTKATNQISLNLPTGLYLVKFANRHTQTTKKLIIK